MAKEKKERTEIWHGEEIIGQRTSEIWSLAKGDIEMCADHRTPSILSNSAFHIQMFSKLNKKGVNQRLISEITSDNLSHCKELAKVIQVRHLTGIKGQFLIVDGGNYVATVIPDCLQSAVELIHSNVEAVVKQQRSLFETLWNQAISADERIREIEEGVPVETTEIVHGFENIVRSQIAGLASTESQYDACTDQTFPASLLASKPVWDLCLKLQKRGVKIRTITEITPNNLVYCKEMAKRMELRHMADIRGNFSVRDKKEYRGAAAMKEGEPPTEGIRSTANVFVEQQQYFFETLWNKAVPAGQRMREIEQGIAPEIIETLSTSAKIQEFANNLVKVAGKELLIMFASQNEFRRQQNSPTGFLQALSRIPRARKARLDIRITLPSEETITDKGGARIANNVKNTQSKKSEFNRHSVGKLTGARANGDETATPHLNFGARAQLRYFEAQLSTRVTIIIVDRKFALVVELKGDAEYGVSDLSSGLGIYSNSSAIVLSYVSIFELLWTHIELYEEMKAREIAQKEFINIAVHELRTPIQPILGLAEEIRARQMGSDEGRLLGIILRSASNLQKLADNLLDVARIQNSNLRLSLTRFDLNELISSVVADYAIDAARSKSVGIEFKSGNKRLQVYADRERIYQVLSNCLQNALRFTESGTIVVSSMKTAKFAIVSLRDNGRGIDKGILSRLFTKFATTSPSTGSGLGLFISKKIIEAHGGEITGTNNTDQFGATFRFRLPLHIEHESAHSTNRTAKMLI